MALTVRCISRAHGASYETKIWIRSDSGRLQDHGVLESPKKMYLCSS